MATLFRHPASPFWYAQFFTASGKRTSRSTGIRHNDKDKPSREAIRKGAVMEEEAQKELANQHEVQKAFAVVIDRAARAANDKVLTLEAAKKHIRNLQKLANPDYKEPTVEEVMRQWLARKSSASAKLAVSTVKMFGDSLRHLERGLGAKWTVPAHSITRIDVEAAIESLIKSGLSASTVCLSLGCWRSAFKDAVDDDTVVKDPTARVKSPSKVDSIKRAPFSPEEVTRLIESAPTQELKGLILLGGHTGMRMTDIAKLRRLNLHGDKIIVKPAKTARKGKVLEIPMSPQVRGWIDAHAGKDQIFPSLATWAKTRLSARFKLIMAKAGVPDTILSADGSPRSRSFHSLRHSANSWLAAKGIDTMTRRQILGHADDETNEGYLTLDAEAKVEAINLMPEL